MPSVQLEVAIKAALTAGKIINRAAGRRDEVSVREKSTFDFVSEVDTACEQAIADAIWHAFPADVILGEEGGERTNPETNRVDHDNVWIVDPLDGTTNFLHGFPQYAVSIALKHKGRLVVGVIYDPAKNELFTAERGAGAFLNNRRIRVSGETEMSHALIGTGFPFRANANFKGYLPKFERVAKATAGIRRAGSASLDLAYLACGRLDGFWEEKLFPWDMAAGVLMVLEAGGLATDFAGGEGYLESGNLCAATPKIFPSLLMRVGDIA